MEKLITWEKIVKAQPLLQGLLDFAKGVKDDPKEPYFCANEVWYNKGLKEEMLKLVGEETPPNRYVPKFIYTSEAYDIAYDKIYNALPDCRNCNCM